MAEAVLDMEDDFMDEDILPPNLKRTHIACGTNGTQLDHRTHTHLTTKLTEHTGHSTCRAP